MVESRKRLEQRAAWMRQKRKERAYQYQEHLQQREYYLKNKEAIALCYKLKISIAQARGLLDERWR